jgi:cholinesterase
VDYWSYAYRSDPIVSGLISHSGNALSFPLNAPNVTTSNWYNVSAQLGCGSSGDTLPCVRSKNWTEVKAAAAKVPQLAGGNVLRAVPAFYPVVDNVTVFENYTALSHEGRFAKLVSGA